VSDPSRKMYTSTLRYNKKSIFGLWGSVLLTDLLSTWDFLFSYADEMTGGWGPSWF
jgi:hypothetical protein